MITNQSLTVYHKTLDNETRLEKWERSNFKNIWWFGSKGATINQGYSNANEVNVRIPYAENPDINKIAIGDILVKGNVNFNILTQQDLVGYDVYNVTSINDNNFGNNPHLHIRGK